MSQTLPCLPNSASGFAGTSRYRWAGFSLASEIRLPELDALADAPRAVAGGTPDIRIKYDGVLHEEPSGASLDRYIRRENDGRVVFWVRGYGRFSVAKSGEIRVRVAPTASRDAIRTLICGAALGCWCHLRDILVLHACCVKIGERAVAFVGESGAGKSTIAAMFARAGYELLADDLTVLRPNAAGILQVHSSQRTVKLFPDSLERYGSDAHCVGQAAFGTRATKSVMRWHRTSDGSPVPLGAVLVLSRKPDPRQAELRAIRGAPALAQLMTHVYRSYFAGILGRQAGLLSACSRLLGQVQVSEFRYGPGPIDCDRLCELLEHRDASTSAPITVGSLCRT